MEQSRINTISIISNVFNLGEEHKKLCDMLILRRTTAKEFYDHIDATHDYIDKIKIKTYDYKVSYVNGSTAFIEELVDSEESNTTPLVVSIRYSREFNLAVCLVLINPPNFQDKFSSLEEVQYE